MTATAVQQINHPGHDFKSTRDECFYCDEKLYDRATYPPPLLKAIGGSYPTKDHIYPSSKGGKNCSGNRVWCCHKCNQLKGNCTLKQFKNKLVRLLQNNRRDYSYRTRVLKKVHWMITILYPSKNTENAAKEYSHIIS